uniref:NAC046 n=1 Tax=Arundo donax TaxID=35708 RepID=A0A0A8YYY7_ARUDO
MSPPDSVSTLPTRNSSTTT